MTHKAQISVSDLLGLYRSALMALIPVADRIHMTWRYGQSYDDWDAIEESLWKSIVVGVLAHAMQADRPLDLPRYGFSYDSYSFRDLLVVDSPIDLLVVQQFVLDGSTPPLLKVANVHAIDRRCVGRALVRLEESRVILLRNGTDVIQIADVAVR